MKMKIDRKSKYASLLKSLISRRLLLLSPLFSDHVLAEYITVLVCNGKNQNQAVDDLTAFLGRRTEEFVSWLWKLLEMNETQLSALLSSDIKETTSHSLSECDTDRDKAKANKTSKNHVCEGNRGYVNLLDDSCKSDAELLKDHHSISTPPKERTNKLIQSSAHQSEVSKSDSSTKEPSSDRKYKTERGHGFEKRTKTDALQKEYVPILEYAPVSEENSPQCSKLSDLLERKPSAGMRNSNKLSSNNCIQDILKYAPASEVNLPRRSKLSDKNLAGTLGKFPNSLLERRPVTGMQNSNVSKLSECPPISCATNALGTSFSLQPVMPSFQNNQSRGSVWDRLGKPQQVVPSRIQITDVYALDKKQYEEGNILCSPLNKGQLSTLHPGPRVLGTTRLRQVPSLSNSGRKRQFDELGSRIDSSTKTQKGTHNQHEKAFKSPKISEASQSVSPQLRDLKLRLCQVEKEIVNMRTKTTILTSSGLPNPMEDESRTILVTNVHLKATKETISFFFQKCGAVVKVVFLTDNMPSSQERSAYITFQDKEAANRALRYNGASFYSRTIKVSRKGDNSSASTESAQISGQKTQILES